MAPLKVKNLQQVNALSTICPSRPAAEFLRGFGTDRGLAAEFDTQPVACVSIMKTHLIIDIITSRRYIGTGPASARGPQHPVRASTILLAFVATALCGVALGQTAPAAAIVSDVAVAEGTERVLFLGGQQARAIVLLLPGGDGIIGLDSGGGVHQLGGNFLVRTLGRWVAQGFAVVFPDAPNGTSLTGQRLGDLPARQGSIQYAPAFGSLR